MVDEFKFFNLIRATLFIVSALILNTPYTCAQLLWKVSKKGSPTSYILGTHHMIPSDIILSLPAVEQAYTASSYVIGEVSISELNDITQINYLTNAMLAPKDSLLTNLLTENEMDYLGQVFTKYPHSQITTDNIQYFKPQTIASILITTLTQKVLTDMHLTYNPTNSLDLVIQQKAKRDHKKTCGLESIKTQTDILYSSSSLHSAAQKLNELVDILIKNETTILEEIKKITLLYLEQNITQIYLLTQDENSKLSTSFKASDKEWSIMVDNRNLSWIPILQKLFQHNTCFLAVGALHLPGEKGVLSLLKLKGYHVEPIQ